MMLYNFYLFTVSISSNMFDVINPSKKNYIIYSHSSFTHYNAVEFDVMGRFMIFCGKYMDLNGLAACL